MLSRANTLQFIKIGDVLINVANIAYVECTPDYDGTARLRIVFAACSDDFGDMSVSWRGNQAEAIIPHLQSMLGVVTAGTIEVPDFVAPPLRERTKYPYEPRISFMDNY